LTEDSLRPRFLLGCCLEGENQPAVFLTGEGDAGSFAARTLDS
jgi:hypothetical protein